MHSTQRSLTLTLSLCRSTATKGLKASSCTPDWLDSRRYDLVFRDWEGDGYVHCRCAAAICGLDIHIQQR